MNEARERAFDWEALVPRVINPTKVTIIEALLYMERELSAAETSKLLGDPKLTLPHVAYHMRSLADMGILVKTGSRRVQGAIESFYYFA